MLEVFFTKIPDFRFQHLRGSCENLSFSQTAIAWPHVAILLSQFSRSPLGTPDSIN